MHTVFQDGQVTQTVTNVTTHETFSSGSVFIPGFQLASMHSLVVWGVTTTGESAWIDNIQVAAVPEPESYALMLAGLGLPGFMAK